MVRRSLISLALWAAAWAQDPQPEGPQLSAVYTLADYHTARWTSEADPLVKIAGVCQIVPGPPLFTLSCSAPPAGAPRTGRRYYYTVVLFRDLEETLYLAACATNVRKTRCDELRAGMTFSAEVKEQTISIVARSEQLPLRILERRPRPKTIDSPTRGTPSQVKPSTGAPSKVSHSQVSESKGTPSEVKPSQVSIAAGAPSFVPPSETSTAVASPSGARLYVYCPVGSARVYVDGQLIGRPPVEMPILPGRHTVRVEAQGFRDWAQVVQAPSAGTVKLTAELQR